MQRKRLFPLIALPVVAAVAAGCGAAASSGTQAAAGAGAAVLATPLAQTSSSTYDLIPNLVEQVSPAVVSVITDSGQGSGVVWDGKQGIVVTNNHVVEGSSTVQLVLSNGDRIGGHVLATDPQTDLAVIRADRGGLTQARFADQAPRVGELALALGNPLGFENSVTAGIVSALHRSLDTSTYIDLIQTDAPISPGNSGGALVNENGEVIGINSAGIPSTQNANSIGFAIPSTTVIPIVRQLLETGTAGHAFLGIGARELTDAERQQHGIDAGLEVSSVSDGSAAAAAGVQPGDVIVDVGGQPVGSVAELVSVLRSHVPGDQVAITILRGTNQLHLAATLTNRSSAA